MDRRQVGNGRRVRRAPEDPENTVRNLPTTRELRSGFRGRPQSKCAINASEQVVGWSWLTGSSPFHAFLWTQAVGMQDLGTLGGENSAAEAVNRSGHIVGLSDLSQTSVTHAVLWTAPNQMLDLGTLGGNYAVARGINDSEQVVGWSFFREVTEYSFSSAPSSCPSRSWPTSRSPLPS